LFLLASMLRRHGWSCDTCATSWPAGRGVAVVFDDPRYDLVPLPVEVPGQGLLSIRLVSVWDSRHAAAPTLDEIAQRLSVFTCERYGVLAA